MTSDRAMARFPLIFLLLLVLFLVLVLDLSAPAQTQAGSSPSVSARVPEGARREVRKGTRFEAGYFSMRYPGGDVPRDIGVCADLVVRAFRNAGIDLQRLLHEDRVRHPERYPTRLWTSKRADANIDHRRCQNLVAFFASHATSLTARFEPPYNRQWAPGDVVFFVRPGKKYPWHVAIVSNNKAAAGGLMILHLYPPHAHEAPLSRFAPVHSHFRWSDAAAAHSSRGWPP